MNGKIQLNSKASILQLDQDIRNRNNLKHFSLNFLQERLFSKKLSKETRIGLNLLQPCSKKKDPNTLKEKGLETRLRVIVIA